MIVTTIDPMTGNKVTELEHHPFVVEGSGMATLKINFESLNDVMFWKENYMLYF